MYAKIRGAYYYLKERWIFLLGIVVLLLTAQFLISMAYMHRNRMTTRVANFLEGSRLNDFFQRNINNVSAQQWVRQSSPFWNSLKPTTPFVVLEPKHNSTSVSMSTGITRRVSPSSTTRRSSRPPHIRHVNVSAKTGRPLKEGVPLTTTVVTTSTDKPKEGSQNKPSYLPSITENTLPICPLIPKGLVGPIAINMTETDFLSLEDRFKELEPGGHYKPKECQSRHRVAIVIPYRNRERHLKIFLNNMHPFLQKQQLEYGIYVVEQKEGTTFNRAMLMNIGFTEAMKQYDYQCSVFHDVDLVPEDDRNIYSCPEQPRHLSVAIDSMAYKLPYVGIFGGANEMRTEHFRKVNGFSNKFWGWGGEDDDMSSRVRDTGLHITRYPVNIARYKMIHHQRDKGNPVNPRRFDLMRKGLRRYNLDGLNTLKYNLLKLEKRKLYTWVYVDVNERNS